MASRSGLLSYSTISISSCSVRSFAAIRLSGLCAWQMLLAPEIAGAIKELAYPNFLWEHQTVSDDRSLTIGPSIARCCPAQQPCNKSLKPAFQVLFMGGATRLPARASGRRRVARTSRTESNPVQVSQSQSNPVAPMKSENGRLFHFHRCLSAQVVARPDFTVSFLLFSFYFLLSAIFTGKQ
jgi:hypothetical protein